MEERGAKQNRPGLFHFKPNARLRIARPRGKGPGLLFQTMAFLVQTHGLIAFLVQTHGPEAFLVKMLKGKGAKPRAFL